MNLLKTKTNTSFSTFFHWFIQLKGFFIAKIFFIFLLSFSSVSAIESSVISKYNVSQEKYESYVTYLTGKYEKTFSQMSESSKQSIARKIDILLDASVAGSDDAALLLALKTVVLDNKKADSLFADILLEKQQYIDSLGGEIFNEFQLSVLQDTNVVLEEWIWYSYIYTKFNSFKPWVIPSKTDLEYAGISLTESLLVLDRKGKEKYVRDYKKVKLIDDSIISNISNKRKFLVELADDKKHIHTDTDELFIRLQNDTQEITQGLESDEEKIQAIYAYILEHINYTPHVDFDDKKIFSWILTYKNGDGVCEGYTKMFLYMLSFAWIQDVSTIRWYVINAPDFPRAWHIWVQIWDVYYDPTYDDPIWSLETKAFKDYDYFALPKDLFYTSRYEYELMPEYIKELTLREREEIIEENRRKLFQ